MRHNLRDLNMRAALVTYFLIAPPLLAAPPETTDHRAVVTRVSPVYPELAKRMGITGTVTLRVFVLPNGTVSETHVESGHAMLRQSAEDAVHHWRFVAAASSSECIVALDFELPH